MANISRYTNNELSNKGMEVYFDLKKVFDMLTIEHRIFFHVNFDKLRKVLFLNT